MTHNLSEAKSEIENNIKVHVDRVNNLEIQINSTIDEHQQKIIDAQVRENQFTDTIDEHEEKITDVHVSKQFAIFKVNSHSYFFLFDLRMPWRPM